MTHQPTTESELFAYVGRQAIFDRGLHVVAYELLYRDSMENRARFHDQNQASAATILNAFVEIGLDALVGHRQVYVNLTSDFLLGTYPLPSALAPERVMLEVLENVPVTPALVDALTAFRARGFKVALDDFILTDTTRPLLAIADVIKIDVLGVARDELAAQFAGLRGCGATLLAEKISTYEELEFLRDLGFELFQGYFLELPIITKSRRLPHDRTTLLRLLGKLYDPKADLHAIGKLISADVGLTFRLLKLASSAALSRGASIGTIDQAVARLGTQQLAALVVLVMVSGFDEKPRELLRQALIRARMCELLATDTQVSTGELFTAGLLSLLDALLDQPLAELLRQLPVSPVIAEALGTGSTMPAQIVHAVRAQERCDFDRVAATGLPADAVFRAWHDAVLWADELIALM